MVKSKNETKKNIINYQGKGVTKKRQFKKRKQRRVLKGGASASKEQIRFTEDRDVKLELVAEQTGIGVGKLVEMTTTTNKK